MIVFEKMSLAEKNQLLKNVFLIFFRFQKDGNCYP